MTIKAGDTSAPYEHAAQGDDVYKDAGEISVGIKSAVDVDGRTFENLELGGAAKGGCHRHHRRVVAKLTATPSVTEGGEITYTITLTNKRWSADQQPRCADLHAERRQNRHHRAGQWHYWFDHRDCPGQRLRRHQPSGG
nr:immunoglobulin-like domain-containing protein [Pseudomonas monteilii]